MKMLLLSLVVLSGLTACNPNYDPTSTDGTLHNGHYGQNVVCTQEDVKRHYCKK
jgi:hypothetical protein